MNSGAQLMFFFVFSSGSVPGMVPPTAKVTLPTLLYLIQLVSHKHAQKACKVDSCKVDIPMKIDRQFIKKCSCFIIQLFMVVFPPMPNVMKDTASEHPPVTE